MLKSKTAYIFVGALFLLGLNSFSQTKKKAEKPEIKMEKELDRVSYSLGVNIGQNMKTQGMDSLNVEAFAKAIRDVYSTEGKLAISAEEANKLLQEYFQKAQATKFDGNKKLGEDFLAQNKSKPGVVTLPSGLQYMVITEGTGPKPTATETVKTHYHGTTVDGKVFDSSVERGEPISFPVNGVIAGWTEALQLMPVGSKWKLFIPYQLAYGERGAGPSIGPYSTLIFDVELISIEPKK